MTKSDKTLILINRLKIKTLDSRVGKFLAGGRPMARSGEVLHVLETVAMLAQFQSQNGERRAGYFFDKGRSSYETPPIFYIERVSRVQGLVSLKEASMSVLHFLDPDHPEPAKKKLVKACIVGDEYFLKIADAGLKSIVEIYKNSGTEIVFEISYYR